MRKSLNSKLCEEYELKIKNSVDEDGDHTFIFVGNLKKLVTDQFYLFVLMKQNIEWN